MKIQKVKIKDFKIIKDLEVELNGANVLLIGDNEVGKSSFIQFVEIALGKQSNIPVDATGEGLVVADKNGNEYKFHVKFKSGKPVITIETPDGFKDTRKSILAQITGANDFDIDEFITLSNSTAGRKKQVEIFKTFLDEETRENLVKYEQNVKVKYDERTELGRVLKEKEAVISASPYRNELSINIEKIDVSSEMQKLDEANKHNANIDRINQGIEDKAKSIIENHTKILSIKAKIEALEQEISVINSNTETLETDIKKGNEWLKSNAKKDISEIQQKISEASEINIKYSKIQELRDVSKLVEKMQLEHDDLTANIEASRQAIADAIRDMKTPVEGVSFDAEQLLYNGIPVNENNLSTSQIMELGIKLKMAENPEAPLFLQRGESLGAKRYKEILELCKKNGYQLIMEQVQRGVDKLQIELIAD